MVLAITMTSRYFLQCSEFSNKSFYRCSLFSKDHKHNLVKSCVVYILYSDHLKVPGQYVSTVYDKEWYTGVIVARSEENEDFQVKFMKNGSYKL